MFLKKINKKRYKRRGKSGKWNDGFKHCTKCGFMKPVSDFCKDKNQSDSLQCRCKACFGRVKNPKVFVYKREFPDSPPDTKYCKVCRELKPLTAFHPNKYGFRGKKPTCKFCMGHKPTKDRFPEPPEGYKWCTKCEELKSFDKFHNLASAKDGLRSQCKTCVGVKKPNKIYPPAPDGLKYCRSCGELKALMAFCKESKNKDGRDSRCKPCSNDRARKIMNGPCSSEQWFFELLPVDAPRWNKDSHITVECYMCRKRFVPTYMQVQCRVRGHDIRGNDAGYYNFYCSDKCKNECQDFGKKARIFIY